MDLILLISIIILVILSFFYIRFTRFVRKMTSEQGRILHRSKKQAEMIVDTANKQEDELDDALAASRARLVGAFEGQVENDAKRIGKALDTQMREFSQEMFLKVDAHVAETLKRVDAELEEYKKRKVERADEQIHAIIKSVTAKSITKGLSLQIHEDVIEKALKEALSEYAI